MQFISFLPCYSLPSEGQALRTFISAFYLVLVLLIRPFVVPPLSDVGWCVWNGMHIECRLNVSRHKLGKGACSYGTIYRMKGMLDCPSMGKKLSRSSMENEISSSRDSS